MPPTHHPSNLFLVYPSFTIHLCHQHCSVLFRVQPFNSPLHTQLYPFGPLLMNFLNTLSVNVFFLFSALLIPHVFAPYNDVGKMLLIWSLPLLLNSLFTPCCILQIHSVYHIPLISSIRCLLQCHIL